MSVTLLVREYPFKKPIASTVEMSDRDVITAFKEIIKTRQGQTFKNRQKYCNSSGSRLQKK